MMVDMSEHTPGPWWAERTAIGQWVVLAPGWIVTEVVTERRKADAHLIAATPDLLAALEGAPALVGVWNIDGKRSISSDMLSVFVDAYNEWAEAARAAIAKAKGAGA